MSNKYEHRLKKTQNIYASANKKVKTQMQSSFKDTKREIRVRLEERKSEKFELQLHKKRERKKKKENSPSSRSVAALHSL